MNLPATPPPDFADPAFLRAHVADTMAFYHPRAIDPAGGFFHYFRDDGSVYDASHRHLVSSTRFVHGYAMAAVEFDDDAVAGEYRAAVEHGLRYLRDAHREADGGYVWTLRDGAPEDRTRHAYGMAFVLLACASARKAGIDTGAWMDEVWDVLETHVWDAGAGLYRDEAAPGWRFSAYRGQNANMHLCEALIAAFEASGEARYLDRALLLANHMTRRQAALAGGLVWEHYDADWNVDWDYHRDDPKHLFRPWGFQPGHQVEWAKLLLTLRTHLSARGAAPDWLLPISLLIYLTTLIFRIQIPSWPTNGTWFFNPLAWQLIFVLGFSMSRERGPGGWVKRNILWLRLASAPIVVFLGVMGWFNLWWDPTKVPEPRLLFLIGKTFVTPVRLIQFMALIALMSAAYPYIVRVSPGLVSFLSRLGRNSLPVFCVGSVLSLAGQIVRFAYGGGLIVDTLLVGSGIAVLSLVAWLAEWRSRKDQAS